MDTKQPVGGIIDDKIPDDPQLSQAEARRIVTLAEHKSEQQVNKWLKQPLAAWPRRVLERFVAQQNTALKQSMGQVAQLNGVLQQVQPVITQVNSLSPVTLSYAIMLQRQVQRLANEQVEQKLDPEQHPTLNGSLAEQALKLSDLANQLKILVSENELKDKLVVQDLLVRIGVHAASAMKKLFASSAPATTEFETAQQPTDANAS